ncbi:MAG TPA: hypothetical protein VFN67_37520 [Polyangiales bacterium]|nr:hypothetical protein [Polyangiales bacterium]
MPNNLHEDRPDAQANDAETSVELLPSWVLEQQARRAERPQLPELPVKQPSGADARARVAALVSAHSAEAAAVLLADRPTLAPEGAAAAAVQSICFPDAGEGGYQQALAAHSEALAVQHAELQSLGQLASTRLEAAQGSKPVPKWKAARRERRVAAAVLSKEEERLYRFPWMSPDDHDRSDEELETLDLNRRVLLANTRHKDGSLLARLESVFAPREKQQFRCIRDDALFAATEWGRLWRADRLLAKLTLEACLGMRGDGTCLRDWHSQRARNMLAIVWMFYTCGSTRGADPGEFRVRGVSINWLCAMLATEGKAALHRNTLGGTHRSDSARNEDVGYLTALENARVITRMQYGDRWQNQKVQEYHLRVSTQSEQLTAMLTAEESRFREWMSVRWEKLSELEALHVLTSHAHKRFVRMRHADMLREIAGSLLDSSDAERAGATDPPF